MTAPSGNLNYFRRSLAAFAVWMMCVLAVMSFTSRDAASEEKFNPGTGNAQARLVKADPRQGGLSFGITNGLALSGHQNIVAQADSRAVDLGVIGTTLAGEGCDGGDATLPKEQQPQAVVVRSDDEKKSKESNEIPGVHQKARANSAPFAEAITTSAPFGVPGVVEFGNGVARTTSGVVENNVREARAVVEYSKISFGGGAVTLNGVRWEAVHRSGAKQLAQGSFTVDALSTAAGPVPIGDGAEALNSANDALRLLGFELVAPKARVVEGVVFVDPMRIGIVSSELRDNVTGLILTTAKPVREQLFDQLIAAKCGNATYITLADIGLGVVSASGQFSIEIGGVQATSAEIDFFEFGPGGGLSAPPPATPAAPVDTGPSDTGIDTSSDTVSETPETSADTAKETTTTEAPSTEEALPVSNNPIGKRGGAMAFVAGAGLLLIGAMAEGDRRKMLRAQRQIPMEMA